MNFQKSGFGFGKTILFGEHFVVYGLPAIVCALSCKTIAKVRQNVFSGEKIKLIDNRPKVSYFKYKNSFNYQKSIENILNFALINKNLRIELSGDLTVCSGGIGASAAMATSISRALNNYFNLGWDNQKINQAAFLGEKAVHGNPSGIDNTVSVFGGAFLFQKNLLGEQNFIETISFKESVKIVLIDSGITSNTKMVLQQVKEFKNKNEEFVSSIFVRYQKLFILAKDVLCDEFDLEKIGLLMNENHKLLQQLGVSCEKLDFIVNESLKSGALGAKLTGTGLGGLVLALTPGKELQDNVAKALQKKGYFVLKTDIGNLSQYF